MRRVATTAFALVLLAASAVATTGINFSVCGKETADPSSDWSLSVTFDSAGDCNTFSQGMGVSATQGSVFGFPACGSRTYCFNGNSTAQFAVSPDQVLPNMPQDNPGDAAASFSIQTITWASLRAGQKPPVMHVRGVFGDTQSCYNDDSGQSAFWTGVTPTTITLGTQGTCTTKQNTMRSMVCGAGEYRNFDVSGDCGTIIFPTAVALNTIVYDPPAAESPFGPPSTPAPTTATTTSTVAPNASTATVGPTSTAVPAPNGSASVVADPKTEQPKLGINLATCGQHAADAGSDWTLSIMFRSETECANFAEGMGLATTQGSVRGYAACSVRTMCFNGGADAQFALLHDSPLPAVPTTTPKSKDSFSVTSILWSSLHEGQAPPVMRIRGIYGNTQSCYNYDTGASCYWSGIEASDANLGTQGTCLTSNRLNNCQTCGASSIVRDFDVVGDCGSLTATYPFYVGSIVYAPGAITPTPVPTQ